MAKIIADAEYSDDDLLELCREAIASLMAGGQRYRIGSREYQFADLDALRKQVEWLEARNARRAAGGLGWRNVRFKRRSAASDDC
jgi:hypothetical protein